MRCIAHKIGNKMKLKVHTDNVITVMQDFNIGGTSISMPRYYVAPNFLTFCHWEMLEGLSIMKDDVTRPVGSIRHTFKWVDSTHFANIIDELAENIRTQQLLAAVQADLIRQNEQDIEIQKLSTS